MKNDFEYKIDKFIEKINKRQNIIGWKNNPSKTHDGIYIKNGGEKFDYTIISNAGVFCFDAKMTEKKEWWIKPKDLRQAKNLYSAQKDKTFVTSFFIIYFFHIQSYRIIGINDFINVLDTRKHIKVEDCKLIKLEDLIFGKKKIII